MTIGVAGIGKTVSVQKFILDWTDGVANQNVDFMFPILFRELNLIRSDQYSLHRLLLDFHPELRELMDSDGYKECQVVFIFDGLDESRLLLDFQQNAVVSDSNQTSSVDVLITSLIQGSLLPSALIWITSRPAAANIIPARYIQQLTEVRGFSDRQKEEYFQKRSSDESYANRIISHIKACRSLYILSHIPVFCWIAAIVFQQMLKKRNTKNIPKTMTEMFVHFLLIHTNREDGKHQGSHKKLTKKLSKQRNREMILKLAELAFKNMENNNLMFYEEDLRECGIDLGEDLADSGMHMEIFKVEKSVFQQRKVYCFVHLSIQEFLAALYAFHSYVTDNHEALTSLLSREHRVEPSKLVSLSLKSNHCLRSQDHVHVLLKSAVDGALESRSGHLDLFLRFLMGLSLKSNQRLLKGLLTHTRSSSESVRETCRYIKSLNQEDLSPERCINLFHCLLELKDVSMHKEIQQYLKTPTSFKAQLSPAHCSALAHMLLMSEEVLEEFDLKKYNTSDEGRRRLLPAVRCFRTAWLDRCGLTDTCCRPVASALQSPNALMELDLSKNHLGESGVEVLFRGLRSPHCKLQILGLAGCGLTDKSCEIVANVLKSPNSLTELDLSDNDLRDSGIHLLSKGLCSPHCRLLTLRLANCRIRKMSCWIAATVLQSPNCLVELDLSDSMLGDSGVQLLFQGLSSPHCRLRTLWLSNCRIADEGYVCLALMLMLNPSCVKELNVGRNHQRPSARKLLSSTLEDPRRKVEALQLTFCKLGAKSCEILSFVLQSPNSLLELNLSDSELGDSGIRLLSKGLSSPNCKLQTLRLLGCLITGEGCDFLASSLTSNPSHLKELDLSYNHPGESGLKLLSARLEDPHCQLETLKYVYRNLKQH
ncbi:hypothetical protein ACEWY4_017203 [Coilia grayii]|uniref:NACHT domain-containing protein n=1 Tax=Coilia grayii TaxID=363190 RepID=A0ABD1JGF1_9TELE